MGRLSSRVGYWSAGLALVLVVALLGASGHGLPALGVQMLKGEAWLVNTANRSVSLVNGYSGKVSSQVGLPGVSGALQVVNTPGGAVVTGQNGRMVKVSNADFTTSGAASDPIKLVSGTITAAGGQQALYALDQATGQIRRLDPSSPQLAPIGPVISAGSRVTTPVVASDGSLYVAIRSSGAVGRVADGNLTLIKGVSRPGDRLGVVLAGTQMVAADLSQGTVMPLGTTAVSGPTVHLPPTLQAVQLAGSDTADGLVGVIGAHAVDSVNVATRTQSSTPLQPAFSPTAAAMQGHKVVLINSQRHQVLVVDTASGHVDRLPMPGPQPPDQITVRDRLVFVNASDGASALVINGSGGVKTVTKYTGPPPSHPKPLKFPTPARTKAQPVNTPATPQPPKNPHRPGAPAHPRAVAGNASATISWGAANANGGAITNYRLSWTGSDGSSGQKTLSGNALGTTVGGLANGTPYVFTVAAVNSAGQGPGASTPPVTPSSNVPNVPSGVTATASQPDGSVSLSWSAPGKGGAQVASYTITEVGTGAQVESGVTGTSTTLGASQGLVVGTAVQFQVTAIGTSGLSSTPSAPSAAVTPFQAPGAPTVTNPVYATSGTSATLTVSCDTTCQEGRPAQTYQVTLSPSGPSVPAVTAAPGGGATTISLTGLTPNTSYTASVTVTDSAGVTGQPDVVSLTMPGPPSVSNVKVSGSGLTLAVTATVTDGGETTTCSISVSGGSSASGNCGGTISVGVSTYNTSYTVTFTATNPAGSNSATGSGMSGLKALTADATDAFGTCTQYPPPTYKFCGGNSDVEPGPNFTTSTGSVKAGTVMSLSCWTTGGVDHGNVPAYKAGTNQWVHVTNSPGPGYMSILWFPNPNSVTSGLPKC